jgi:hypothetical protein
MKHITHLLFLLSPVLALITQQRLKDVHAESDCKWCCYIAMFLAFENTR